MNETLNKYTLQWNLRATDTLGSTKCPDYQGVLIIWFSRSVDILRDNLGPLPSVQIMYVSLLVRCPDFRGLNVCTLIQMGPWTSVLIIKVSLFQVPLCLLKHAKWFTMLWTRIFVRVGLVVSYNNTLGGFYNNLFYKVYTIKILCILKGNINVINGSNHFIILH